MLEPLIPASCRQASTRKVAIGDVVFGADEVPVIAGPCSVEPGYLSHATEVAAAGASVLRGCVFKPRTRPDAFQGLGAAGFDLLDAARSQTGLPIVAEPLGVDHITDLAAHVDALQIGTRSMQNTPLLRAAGRSGLPVILKRGMSATLDEWLSAAEYIFAEGNTKVILCERGIRTFETATRNTLDLSAIPVLRQRTDLPIIVDPSHAAGTRDWVAALAMAAVAAGADGLLIEAHPEPDAAWSDAAQAIDIPTLHGIIRSLMVLTGIARTFDATTIPAARGAIDRIDTAIALLIERRAEVTAAVQAVKQKTGTPARDRRREQQIAERVAALAPSIADSAERITMAIIDACTQAAAVKERAIRPTTGVGAESDPGDRRMAS